MNPGFLKRFVRHVVVVDGRYVVLLDHVLIGGPGRLDLDLHFQTRGKVRAFPDEFRAEITCGRAQLHVIAAAPADAIVRQGRRELSFVQISPGIRQRENVFATVLYPDHTGAEAPRVEWQASSSKLLLTVERERNRSDKIEFTGSGNIWTLSRVNGASAARVPPASKQSLFRVGK